MSQEFKQACQLCGGRTAYTEEHSGRTIQCPHCHQPMTLAKILGNPSQPTNVIINKPWPSTFFRKVVIAVALSVPLVLLGLGLGIWRSENQKKPEINNSEAQKDELRRTQLEVEKLKAEAAQIKATTEIEQLKIERERNQRSMLLATNNDSVATVRPAEAKTIENEASIQERKKRAEQKPGLLAVWEETDNDSIRIVSTRANEATITHKGSAITAAYDELPNWLGAKAKAKHREDGEQKGLIREVNGKVYDLRELPGGWVKLPPARVIQLLDDGYLLIDSTSLDNFDAKVFKLKHNGLSRVLNTGDRIQVMALSAGTYTYQNKRFEVKTVPAYDPGMPVGELRERTVTMRGTPKKQPNPVVPSTSQPIKSGSGFFISDDGLFITNAHVVEDSAKVEIRTAAGKKNASVLRIDKEKDLALLRVSVETGTIFALNILTKPVSLGTQVFTIGYPMVELQGTRPKFTDGKVSSMAGFRDNPDEIQISVAVQPGNSGGPLTDNNGDLVGVIVSQLDDLTVMSLAGSIPQSVNYAIKSTTLIRFINENKTLIHSVSYGSSPPRTSDEAIKAVEKASGLVLAY